MSLWKKLLSSTLIVLFLWILTGYLSAKFLTRTNQTSIKPISSFEGLKVQNLSIGTADDVKVSCWFIEDSKDKAIILLSGIKGNRRRQLNRAKYYLSKGYSVLLPDLRGTGNTKGEFISFGWHERKDLTACYNHLKKWVLVKLVPTVNH